MPMVIPMVQGVIIEALSKIAFDEPPKPGFDPAFVIQMRQWNGDRKQNNALVLEDRWAIQKQVTLIDSTKVCVLLLRHDLIAGPK